MELIHPAAPRHLLTVNKEPMYEHPQSYLEEIQYCDGGDIGGGTMST